MKKLIPFLMVLSVLAGCKQEKKQETKTPPPVVIEQPTQPVFIDTTSTTPTTGELTEADSLLYEDPYPEEVAKPTLPEPEPTPIIFKDPPAPVKVPQRNPPVAPPIKTPVKGIFTNPDRLQRNLTSAQQGDPIFKRAQANAIEAGNDALKEPIKVVGNKKVMIDAKDNNDFNSVAPYWHYNTKCRCWKRIDGKGNGLSGKIGDTEKLQKGIGTVIPKLARAYVASNNPVQKEKYAARAVEYCYAFFINPATRMNPNLNYAQVIPGQKIIRVETAVEGEKLVDIVDALSLIQDSKAYTPEFDREIKKWFAEMANWMANSPTGKEADKKAIGNIGVIYETMRMSFAVFGGDDTYAVRRWPRIQARLFDELAADGELWRETERHKANMYSNKALQAWIELFRVLAMQGIDCWPVEKNGESLEEAITFLTPYMLKKPGKVLAKGEKVNPGYFLKIARTGQYVYRNHPETVRILEEFLRVHDGRFRAGHDPEILTEPYLERRKVAVVQASQRN